MNGESSGGAQTISRARGFVGGFQLALAFFILIVSVLLMPARAFAAAPPAGATIGNQATASYTDAGGTSRTTTSNLVVTNILQVAGVSVQSAQTVNSAPGSTVYLPHTITNTGNGNDIYNLLASQVVT